LFLDADVRLAPDCLGRAVAAQQALGSDLLTVLPRLVAEGLWERANQPLLLSLAIGWQKPSRVNDPRSTVAQANGPFMLFRRTAYEEVGGHARVRDDVVEDLALARALKRRRLRLSYLFAVEQAEVRMYDSLASIFAGWSKNLHVALGGARAGLLMAPLATLGIWLLYATPYVTVPLAAAVGDGGALLSALLAAAATLGGRLVLRRGYGVPLRGALAQPLGALVVGVILLRSAVARLGGRGVVWKGRRYPPISGG
jgi:hypothetical protein